MELTIKLEDSTKNLVPNWASKATHYYENEYREQQIAMMKDEKILITGSDIGWVVYESSMEEAKAEVNRLCSGEII